VTRREIGRLFLSVLIVEVFPFSDPFVMSAFFVVPPIDEVEVFSRAFATLK